MINLFEYVHYDQIKAKEIRTYILFCSLYESFGDSFISISRNFFNFRLDWFLK